MSTINVQLWRNPYAWDLQKVRHLSKVELDAVLALLGVDPREARGIEIDTDGTLTVTFVEKH